MNRRQTPRRRPHDLVSKRALVLLVIWLAVLLVIIPKISGFTYGLHALRQANAWLVLLGAACVAGSFAAAAGVYQLIAAQLPPYSRTLLVQCAGGFANRLVPAGAGAMAVSARYVRRNGYTAAQTTSIVFMNNVLGFAGNVLLLLTIVAVSRRPARQPFTWHTPAYAGFIPSVLLGIVLVLMLFPSFRRQAGAFIKKLLLALRQLLRQPGNLLMGLLASVILTLLYALALEATARAFGARLSPLQLYVVFSAGVVAAGITPTPGGIGGAEAGLTAALVSVGLTAETALPIALVYRFLVFWLPLVPGFICFRSALKRQYI